MHRALLLDRKAALCHKNEIPYEYKTRINHMHAFIEIQTKFIQQTNSKIPFDCFSSLQQQSLLIYRPGLLKATTLFSIYMKVVFY